MRARCRCRRKIFAGRTPDSFHDNEDPAHIFEYYNFWYGETESDITIVFDHQPDALKVSPVPQFGSTERIVDLNGKVLANTRAARTNTEQGT